MKTERSGASKYPSALFDVAAMKNTNQNARHCIQVLTMHVKNKYKINRLGTIINILKVAHGKK